MINYCSNLFSKLYIFILKLNLYSTKTIAERENEYMKRKNNRMLSPDRLDPFSEQTPDINTRGYRDTVIE